MNGVKLTAQLLLFVLVTGRRKIYFRYRVGDFAIDTFPCPKAVLCRITVRTVMRRANTLAVVELFVVVVVTSRTGLYRPRAWRKVCSHMLFVTRVTGYASCFVRFRVRRVKLRGRVTANTRVLHRLVGGVTGRARICVLLKSDRAGPELQRVRIRQWFWFVGLRISQERKNADSADQQERPSEQRKSPGPTQIAGRAPIEHRLAGDRLLDRSKPRAPIFFLASALLPKNF